MKILIILGVSKSQVYLGHYQASMMELAKLVNGFYLLNIFAKFV